MLAWNCCAALYPCHSLTLMLNSFLRDPAAAHVKLASGWVILLPKTLWPQDARSFKPIVCGEVCAKLAAKLTTNRAVLHWEVPFCCFGSVPGRGLSEALYCQTCCTKFCGLT